MSGYINSVQQVSIAFGASVTSNTATISSVGANAFLVYQGESCDRTTSGAVACVRGTLTNSTTITATRNTQDGSTTATYNCTVIDPASALVTAVQFGTVSISGSTSGTATITSVDTTRSVVFYLGESTTSTSAQYLSRTGVTLTNATTVTAVAGQSETATVSFVVVTFAGSVLKQSVQQFNSAFTTSNTTDTQSITSVNVNNAFIAYGGFIQQASDTAYLSYYALSSSTNVNIVRVGTGTTTRTPLYTVVEFISGVLNSSVQRNTIDMNSNASKTATITSISTGQTLCNYVGNNEATAEKNDDYQVRETLTNATTITFNRINNNNTTCVLSWEIIEFATTVIPVSQDAIWFGMTV